MLPIFTCASVIGNLYFICLDVNVPSPLIALYLVSYAILINHETNQ